MAVIGNWQESVIIHRQKGGGRSFSRGGAPPISTVNKIPRRDFEEIASLGKLAFQEKEA